LAIYFAELEESRVECQTWQLIDHFLVELEESRVECQTWPPIDHLLARTGKSWVPELTVVRPSNIRPQEQKFAQDFIGLSKK
jgi:hypothetical protein